MQIKKCVLHIGKRVFGCDLDGVLQKLISGVDLVRIVAQEEPLHAAVAYHPVFTVTTRPDYSDPIYILDSPPSSHTHAFEALIFSRAFEVILDVVLHPFPQ